MILTNIPIVCETLKVWKTNFYKKTDDFKVKYNLGEFIIWIKRLFMCKKQIAPNDCYEYLGELENSIQCLYTSIDNSYFKTLAAL